MNAIPDGTYTFVGDVLTSVRDLSPMVLQELHSILSRAAQEQRDVAFVVQEIKRTAPELASRLPTNVSQFSAWISAIAAAITVLHNCHASDTKPSHQEVINQTIQIIEQNQYNFAPGPQPERPSAEPQSKAKSKGKDPASKRSKSERKKRNKQAAKSRRRNR